jgi:parvulin-like peptidyl-prolyl isomerase
MPTPHDRRRAAPLPAFALALLLSSCASPGAQNSQPSSPPSAGEAIAAVNGRAIPVKIYEMFVRNGREALGIDESKEEGHRKLAELREGVVSELIDRAVISHEAERRGLRVTPEMLAARERQEIEKLGGDERFNAYLAEHNLTRDDYREVTRDLIRGELMTEEAGKTVTVSDGEIAGYYEEHKQEEWLRRPGRVAASHLLVAARPAQIRQQLQRERNLDGAALEAAAREEFDRRRRRAEQLRRRAIASRVRLRLPIVSISAGHLATKTQPPQVCPPARSREDERRDFLRKNRASQFFLAAQVFLNFGRLLLRHD